MTIDTLIIAMLVGVGATLILDLWAELIKFVAKVQPTNWCLVGRWFAHMPAGVFKHTNITSAAQKDNECIYGWVAHYIIGASYGVLLVALVTPQWLNNPTIIPALLFGLATMIFPLFVMQPAFGFGIASSKTASPNRVRFKTIISHSIYGIGMYLTAILIVMI